MFLFGLFGLFHPFYCQYCIILDTFWYKLKTIDINKIVSTLTLINKRLDLVLNILHYITDKK